MATASTTLLANGLTLSYAAQGTRSGLPTVFLPGPTDSWLSYRSVLERMAPALRVVAVSQRGHGDSDKPSSGYHIDDFAGDVRLLLDALDCPSAVLVGHSGSCLTARRFAIDHPDRVAGLVLEASPSTLVGDAGLSDFVASVVSALHDPIDPAFARSVVIDTSSTALADDVANALVDELLKVPARVWREMFSELLRYDDRDELQRVAAPTLLIWGDNDPLVGIEHQQELLGRLPDARMVTYEDAGHTPRWEDPSRFAADVSAFVERIPAP